MSLLRPVAPRSGPLARILRYPNPLEAPWRRPLLEASRAAAIGDVLMCTPALREVKRQNPRCRIHFYTDYPGLVRGLPYIDEVRPFQERPRSAVYLGYEDAVPPRARITNILGDKLGIKVKDIWPDCVFNADLVRGYRDQWRAAPHPHIVLNRHAGNWTPNKEWPDSYWDTLIARLAEVATVIEIGLDRGPSPRVFGGHYLDLRGRTSLDELAAAIAAADLHVGVMSGPVHIAAAARRPSVVIFGGYEHPSNTVYPGNESLYTPVSCAPCWLRDPCPYQRKCLSAITPDAVEAAISRIWSRQGRP
jgi:ADP-heptose:LPS heptosyltransferase